MGFAIYHHGAMESIEQNGKETKAIGEPEEVTYHSFSDLYQQFSGPAIIIGYGKSASQLLTNQHWQSYMSISCNYAQLSFPSPCFVAQDLDFWTTARERLVAQDSYGMLIGNKIDHLQRKGTRGFLVNRIDTHRLHVSKEGISVPLTLCGPTAAILAHAMGFSPLILVGMDMSNETGYQYFRNHPRYGSKNEGIDRYGNAQINFIRKYTDELSLINCSDNTLGRVSLGDALEGLPKNRQITIQKLHRIYEERKDVSK
jgi:hypothetical protein